jgi:hypothetical protein
VFRFLNESWFVLFFKDADRYLKNSQAPVAHACNPRYSRGRDQEDQGSMPVQANNSQDPVLKTTYHKSRAGGLAQGVDPEFKPSTT